MPSRRPRKPADDFQQGTPAWMVTFSDCMQLLLTFFVVLMTFSSFDDAKMARLSGAFNFRPNLSIFSNEQEIDDSIVPEPPSVVDKTEKGAEKPNSLETEMIKNPKEPRPVVDTEAYRDERVFYIPSRRLFLGNGSFLTKEGQDYLERIASFLKLVPCVVIMGEVRPDDQLETPHAPLPENGLARCWTILQFFTVTQGVPPERFCISATNSCPAQRFHDEAVIQICLLGRDVTQ